MKIIFIGNFAVDYSSENHHVESLKTLGHEVVKIQENHATPEQITAEVLKGADLMVWVHTHGKEWEVKDRDVVIHHAKQFMPVISYHLDLWFGLERQKDIENDPFYTSLSHFFATDKLMTDWFTENTNVKGVFLPAGVYHKEAYMAKSDGFKYDIIFVGSRGYHPEWSYRPKLINWLKTTYGGRFAHFGGDGLGVVRGDKLNQLYADSKIVIGDSLNLNFDYPYYTSDRLFETTGRGGFLIYPRIFGLEDYFVDKKEVVFYEHGNFTELQGLIDFYLEHEVIREKIRLAGFKRAKKDHTYLDRWRYIIETINGEL